MTMVDRMVEATDDDTAVDMVEIVTEAIAPIVEIALRADRAATEYHLRRKGLLDSGAAVTVMDRLTWDRG